MSEAAHPALRGYRNPALVLVGIVLVLTASAAFVAADADANQATATPVEALDGPAEEEPGAQETEEPSLPVRLEDRIVVGFVEEAGASSEALAELVERYDGEIVRTDEVLDFAVVEVPPEDGEPFAREAKLLAGVSYAKPDGRVQTYFTPDDPYYEDQWGPPAIGMEEAWDTSLGSHDRTVAVIDTGVDYTHEDLSPNVCSTGRDFYNGDDDAMDDHGHGTHVAGTVAAVIDNGTGVAGMGDSCILPVKALSSGGFGSWSDLASAIRWATDQGVEAISMSLGGCAGCNPGDPMASAVEYAWTNDVLVIAAAGNSYCDPVGYPAAFPEAMAVASVDPPDGSERSSFSSCGPEVEVSAPGRDVVSTVPRSGTSISDSSGYDELSGTSMATPHVSGVAALRWAQDTNLTNVDLRCLLDQTADDLGPDGRDNQYGYGRVDAAEAMDSWCEPEPPPAPNAVGWGEDELARLQWSQPFPFGKVTNYNIYRGKSLDDLSQIDQTGDVRSYNDTTPDNGETYVYRVAAVNDAGEGNLSDPINVTPRPPQTVPFEHDVEDDTDLWTTTGLWHPTDDRSNSADTSWYYGQENEGDDDGFLIFPGEDDENDTDDNDYQTGGRNKGGLVSPQLDLTGLDTAQLVFWHHYESEECPWAERPLVQVSTTGPFGPFEPVEQRCGGQGNGTLHVNLTDFAGEKVWLRFWWDTVDSWSNGYEGWYVDDIRVLEGTPPTPADPEECEVPGPDDHLGYTCRIIPYEFDDIRENGTEIGTEAGANDPSTSVHYVSQALPMEMDFNFYGTSYQEAYVSSLGYVDFQQTSDCCWAEPVPKSWPVNEIIAGMWTYLDARKGTVTYNTTTIDGQDAFVVQFTDVPHCCRGLDPVTFQVQLLENATIRAYYQHVENPGNAHTAAIENATGEAGVRFVSGDTPLRTVGVEYALPDGPDLVVDEITVDPEHPSPGEATSLAVRVRNQGTQATGASTLNLAIEGTDYADEQQIDPLAPGESATIQLADWSAEEGRHHIHAEVEAPANEAVDDNNDRDKSIIVDCLTTGRDAFDYDCRERPLDFLDISDSGTTIVGTQASGPDAEFHSRTPAKGPFDLGFAFNYYGTTYEEVYIHHKAGFLGFGDEPSARCCSGQHLPSTNSPNNLVAGFWEWIYPSDHGNVTYEQVTLDGQDAFIAQWTDVPNAGGARDQVTFQVQLFENGTVRVQYVDTEHDGYGNIAAGTENETGEAGHRWRHGGWERDEVAVEYALPKGPDLVVDDIALDPGFPDHGEPVDVQVTVRNQGDAATEPTDVQVTIDGDAQQTRALPTLDPGESHTVTWSITWTAGEHRFHTVVDPDGDLEEATAENNERREVLEIGCQQPGPDRAGYTCRQIRSDPVALPDDAGELELSGTDRSDAIDLGFSFPYYGATHEEVYVASNGWLTFEPTVIHGPIMRSSHPGPAPPNDVIAGVWADLEPDDGGTIRHATTTVDDTKVFVVAYEEIVTWYGPDVSFQVHLYENGTIEVHYERVEIGDGDLWSGIESSTGTSSLAFRTGSVDLGGEAVRYSPFEPGEDHEQLPEVSFASENEVSAGPVTSGPIEAQITATGWTAPDGAGPLLADVGARADDQHLHERLLIGLQEG